MMLSGVILDRNKLKVFKSVIVLRAIPMVDVLSALQASAKVLLHNDTVLKLVIVANTNCDISI